jgi:hypothetical protein
VIWIFRYVLPVVAVVVTQITFARAAEQVDLLLALAMDVSRSMDQSKFTMQREGYAAAIANPQVLSAIRSGAHQKIAICFIDWSGPFEQRLVVDWSVVDGIDTAVHLGDLISRAPRSFYNSTSIGSAIDFAATQIVRAPFEAERHAIDVSGDGTNNSGRGRSLSPRSQPPQRIYAQHRPSRKQGDHDEQLRASSVPPTHPHERSIRCRRPHAPHGRRLRPARLGADAFLS